MSVCPLESWRLTGVRMQEEHAPAIEVWRKKACRPTLVSREILRSSARLIPKTYDTQAFDDSIV